MFNDMPWGNTPTGKSNYCFSDNPKESIPRWNKINKVYKDNGIEISYIGNSGGYRTKEWNNIDWNNCIALVGDSASYGIGVPEEHSISKLVEKYSGLECVNLSVPGASSELMIAIICSLLEKVELKNVIFNHPSISRIWDPIHSTGNLGVWLNDTNVAGYFSNEQHLLYNEFMRVSERQIHKAKYNTKTIRTLLKKSNIVEWTWDTTVSELINVPYYKYLQTDPELLARDGWHSNIKVNDKIAKLLVERL